MTNNIMEQLQLKAKADPKRVVLPEAQEEKILKAARAVCDMDIAIPILVGKPDDISELAARLDVSLDDIAIVDNTEEAKIDHLSEEYLKNSQVLPLRTLKRMMKDPMNFAAVMVALNEADCMVAGLSHTTGEVIIASEMIIGLKEGISTVSSMGIMSIPGFEGPEGDLIAIADCAVCAAPGDQELADIAISTADTVRSLLGWEPRVALLSFSTKGSAAHERVDTVLRALEMVRERRPDILIDGELQLDSAIVPEVAAKKVPGESPVAGRANVLIFPNLESGNIGVKLVQRFANGAAYGPLLQGFSKTVSDLSRGAPVAEIVGAITMAAVCAQEKKQKTGR
jgi:phosphate acetyltransferase